MLKNEKICKFYQIIGKTSDVKMLKTIPLPPETIQQPNNKFLMKFCGT